MIGLPAGYPVPGFEERMLMATVWLIRSCPHDWGKGKTHIRGRMGVLGYETLCGMSVHGEEIRGQALDVTCRKCIAKAHHD